MVLLAEKYLNILPLIVIIHLSAIQDFYLFSVVYSPARKFKNIFDFSL